MSAKKATIVKNMKEIVEGPATIHDEFKLCAVHMQEIVKELDKNGKPKTVIPNHVVRPILSTELMAGMTIKASSYDKEARREEIR